MLILVLIGMMWVFDIIREGTFSHIDGLFA